MENILEKLIAGAVLPTIIIGTILGIQLVSKLYKKLVKKNHKEVNPTSKKINMNVSSNVEKILTEEKQDDIPGNVAPNKKKKSIIKALKILGSLSLGILILYFSICSYLYYKEEIQPARRALTFATDVEWEWYYKGGSEWFNNNRNLTEIQINERDFKYPILRKVYLEEKRVVYASKNENYELSARVCFITDCKPNTTIKTSQNFSDGAAKILRCNKAGNILSFGVAWKGKQTDIVWEENLDGFSFKENFTYWDFTKLDKKITLLRSK